MCVCSCVCIAWRIHSGEMLTYEHTHLAFCLVVFIYSVAFFVISSSSSFLFLLGKNFVLGMFFLQTTKHFSFLWPVHSLSLTTKYSQWKHSMRVVFKVNRAGKNKIWERYSHLSEAIHYIQPSGDNIKYHIITLKIKTISIKLCPFVWLVGALNNPF